MNNTEVKTGLYLILVGKRPKANQTFEGLESIVKGHALRTNLITHKPVKVVEVRYTGENSVEIIREVISYPAR